MSDPRTWNQKECSKYLMGLAVACTAFDAWRDDMGRHVQAGKVYPLREQCPCLRDSGQDGEHCCSCGWSDDWLKKTFTHDNECEPCNGAGYVPVEPHLETLREAAAGAGYWHETTMAQVGYGHCFHWAGEATPGGYWLWGKNDLLACSQALCLAMMARKGASDERR